MSTKADLYTVHSVDHRTPGNKRGAMATRMRSLRTGSIIDYRFRAEDFVERAVLDEIEFQYLYADGEGYHFMNTESFEQIHVSAEVLGDAVYYLIPDLPVKLEFYEGKPIGARSARHRGFKGGGYRAHRAEGHGQRGDEAGETRDWPDHPGAAVHQQWRQGEGGYFRSALHTARAVIQQI